MDYTGNLLDIHGIVVSFNNSNFKSPKESFSTKEVSELLKENILLELMNTLSMLNPNKSSTI